MSAENLEFCDGYFENSQNEPKYVRFILNQFGIAIKFLSL